MKILFLRPTLTRRLHCLFFFKTLFRKRGVPSCRRKTPFWFCKCCCSLETMHVLMKLLLLCVASCSWSLLIISLSLSTSQQPSRRVVREKGSKFGEQEKRTVNPCLLCKSYEGPSKAFKRNFHRPLNHILKSVNKLDLPLVPSDLRVHLAILRVILVQLIKSLNMSITHETKRKSGPSSKIDETKDSIASIEAVKENRTLSCPDFFLGSIAGYPRYKKGFHTYNCSQETLKKSISVLIWDVDNNPEIMKYWKSDSSSVYIISNTTWQSRNSSITNSSASKEIRRIIENVSTPYILLAPRLHSLRNVNFNRLVYVSEKTNAFAVGGSFRSEEDGHWRIGCVLYNEQDGKLHFQRSYSSSIYECQLCHLAEGPILVRSKWLLNSNWPYDFVHSELMLPHLYFKMNQNHSRMEFPVLVCPDVMFNYNSLNPPWDREYSRFNVKTSVSDLTEIWKTTAKQRRLSRIILASGITLKFPCHYLNDSYVNYFPEEAHSSNNEEVNSKSGLRTCQEAELLYLFKRVFNSCEDLSLFCTLGESFIRVLGNYADPVAFLNLNRESSINIYVNENSSGFSQLNSKLENQNFKIMYSEKRAIHIEGNFWKLKVTPQVGNPALKIHKRFQVLYSLWINGEYPRKSFTPTLETGSESNRLLMSRARSRINREEKDSLSFDLQTGAKVPNFTRSWDFALNLIPEYQDPPLGTLRRCL